MKSRQELYKPKHNTIDYLKSIDISTYSKHMELEIDDYIFSIIMVTVTAKTLNNESDSYIVYLLCADKDNNIITNNFLEKEFNEKSEAEEYYMELLNKIKNNEIKIVLK